MNESARLGRAAPPALPVHELKQASPIVTIQTVSERLEISFPTATIALQNLARIDLCLPTGAGGGRTMRVKLDRL